VTRLLNPSNIHAPVGAYSHTAAVPAGTELIFVSRQVGMRADGTVQDIKLMREVRQRALGAHRPASTAVFIPQLVDPVYLLEVEAVAVKPG
jgi:enamine deaminase RidA (YjgF/YER057c/UK114 family)